MIYLIKQIQRLKRKTFFVVIIFFFLFYNSNAQTDTIYFDDNWKTCPKTIATYYRLHPEKIATKKAVGYKINNTDSLYSIKDYYLKTQKLQFQGFSKDKEAQILVGNSKWYDENDTVLNEQNYNYKEKQNYKLFEWQPIFYINYSITIKSQFTGGLEFCLDCKNKNKLFLGLGYGFSSYNHNYFWLPDAYISYNTAKAGFVKIGGSTRNIYSIVGVSLLNFVDIGFGYSYPILKDKTPELKGFTFGLTFRLTTNQKAYIPLKIGF